MIGLDRIKKYIVDGEFRLIFFSDQVYIVNFDKILVLNGSNITIRSNNEIFSINGKNLSLRRLLEREVLISGRIKSIEVFYDE